MKSNRERYRDMLILLNIKQGESAKLLHSVTRRPCSVRAVRSWLNDPDKPSSRPCPDWAVEGLEYAVGVMQRAMSKRAES